MIAMAAVMPHGAELLVPENGAELRLRKSLDRIKEYASMRKISTAIIFTPHNIRIPDHIGVVVTHYTSGTLAIRNKIYRAKRKCNFQIANDIYERAKKLKLPVVAVNFGALEGPASCMQMDWGTLIPVKFMPRNAKIIIITPAREISRTALIKMGEVVGDFARNSEEQIAIIASADHAHTHSPEGPYGYSPRAKEYDEMVVDALKKGELERLLSMDDKLLEEAKPDSYWQLLMLYGVLKNVNYKPIFTEYAAPSYFGMAVSMYEIL